MKNLFFIFIGVILISCATSKSKSKPKLPQVVPCAADAKIYDRDTKYEGSKLFNLKKLSYSTLYTRMYTPSDSLEKNEIRYTLAKTSERVFKKVFPTGVNVDATQLLQKEFSEIAKTVAYFRKPAWENTKAVEKLVVPNPESSLQLFVDMRTYYTKEQFSNNITFYVFDIKNKKVVYADYVLYKCDPRDEVMLMKTLYYGMNKLKNSIK